jgi:hypothetical protein
MPAIPRETSLVMFFTPLLGPFVEESTEKCKWSAGCPPIELSGRSRADLHYGTGT